MVRIKFIKFCISLFILFLLVQNIQGKALSSTIINIDTLWIKSNRYFITVDTSIYFARDTFLLIQSGLKYKIKADKYIQTKNFYDSIYSKSKDNWIKSELYGFVFREPKNDEDIKLKTLVKSESPFEKYRGKIIGEIHISNLNFLYTTEHKDSVKHESLLKKSIANTHVTTYKKIIQKNLAFKVNDNVNPYILAENERLLRQLASLEDARITIVERTLNKDTVDVIVTTVDVFPVGLDGGFASLKDFKIGFYNTNFIGSGIEWKNMFIFESKYEPNWGFEGNFKYNNIRGSFINLALYYESTEPNKELRGVASRELTTPTINTGGAVDIGIRSYTTNIGPIDSLIDTLITSNYQDYWIGQKLYTKYVTNKNIIINARYFVENFTERPYVAADSNYLFHKKKQFFGSLIYSNVRYMKSKYILGFGITEDVPYGLILQVTGGYELSEFFEYPYIGFDFAYAKYFQKLGYFQIYNSYGGYIDNTQVINEVLRTRINTFSNLYNIGNYKLREFVRMEYIQGDNMFDNKSLNMNKTVQGLRHESINGNNRISMGVETVIFTPWHFYGFRFASFTLLEAGFIDSDLNMFNKQNFHSGIGAGFNIRNESLVFSTLSFRISYYPGTPNYNGFWGFNFSLSDPKLFKELTIRKPQVVKYQ